MNQTSRTKAPNTLSQNGQPHAYNSIQNINN